MPQAKVGICLDAPSVDVFVDMGHPFLNRTVDGFLKIGLVGVAHAGLQESLHCLNKDSISKYDIETSVKKIGLEGLHWGVIASVYTGMEYGMQQARGKRDWKNAMLGGALTGAILTLADSQKKTDKVLRSLVTGGAIASASEILTGLL